jgi:hypothetical protein
MLTWHIMLGTVFTIIAHHHIIDHPNTKYQTITTALPQEERYMLDEGRRLKKTEV